MFKRFFKALDNVFSAFDDDLEEMEADNNRRMENLIERASVMADGASTETVVEEEVRPDGTHIKRTITTTYSKKTSKV